MGATFDNPAAIENMNHISMLNGRKPVCDDDGRPALHQNFKRILNLPLGFGIKRLVASSSNRIGASLRMALAIASLWRWPPESLSLARRSRFHSRPVERK